MTSDPDPYEERKPTRGPDPDSDQDEEPKATLERKPKPTPRYDAVKKQAQSYLRMIIWITVPELCESLRNEYKPPDFRRGYTDGEDLTDEEIAELNRLEKIKAAKHQAIMKCEGVTYFDKVLDRFGQKRWWYGQWHKAPTRIEKNTGKIVDGEYIYPKFIRGKDIPPKEPSQAFKYTEFIIDQWAKARKKARTI